MSSTNASGLTAGAGDLIGLLKSVARPVRSGMQKAKAALAGRAYHRLEANLAHSDHVAAATAWLERAQDAGTDRGVSYGAALGGDFEASYPETTGYIIPTILDLARIGGRADLKQRAIEMGDWEIAVQMPSGAVMGGKLNPNPTPAIFNTGQVLLGWSALYRETGEARFLAAAQRAADWMMAMQQPDGGWTHGNSAYANAASTLYNVKAAWGLAEAGSVGAGADGGAAAIAAARRNADLCLSRQLDNGWFPDCCLLDADKPLLHTIAYSMQGLLGIGRLTGDASYISGAELTARGLIGVMHSDGFIPGQIDRSFKASADYSCLTGIAQTSIVLSELYEMTGDEAFRTARTAANLYLMQRHNLAHPNPAVRGGVYGSWPVWGGYGQLLVLNWATKFFIDALLLEARQEGIAVDLRAAR